MIIIHPKSIKANARKQYMKEYYMKNRDKINARQTQYIKDHAEERREYRKERYQAHRELQIQRVKKSQKKYVRCWVFFKDYKDKIDNARTEWEKVMIRNKFHQFKKQSITLRNKARARKVKRRRLKKAKMI